LPRLTVLAARGRRALKSLGLPLTNGNRISDSGSGAYLQSILNRRLPDNISHRRAGPEGC
jgi:hypothetical protein